MIQQVELQAKPSGYSLRAVAMLAHRVLALASPLRSEQRAETPPPLGAAPTRMRVYK